MIRNRNPRLLFSKMSKEGKNIFLKNNTKQDVEEAIRFWRENAKRMRDFLRRFVKEEREVILEGRRSLVR